MKKRTLIFFTQVDESGGGGAVGGAYNWVAYKREFSVSKVWQWKSQSCEDLFFLWGLSQAINLFLIIYQLTWLFTKPSK